MPLKGDNDLLCLTRPDLVADLHDATISRPGPISPRPTRSTPPSISQSDYGLEAAVTDINLAAATASPGNWPIAGRPKTPDKPRFVGGAIGPSEPTLSMSADVNDPAPGR